MSQILNILRAYILFLGCNYRIGWTTLQNKIFNRLYKVLIAARLAKLASAGSRNEPVQRRIYADKTAKRVRQIFSNVCWVSHSDLILQLLQTNLAVETTLFWKIFKPLHCHFRLIICCTIVYIMGIWSKHS